MCRTGSPARYSVSWSKSVPVAAPPDVLDTEFREASIGREPGERGLAIEVRENAARLAGSDA